MSSEMNDSSDESLDIFYRRKWREPIIYTSDEDTLELQANPVDLSCNDSNLHLDMNIQSQGEEWRPLQRREIGHTVTQDNHMQEAELIIRNIDCDDPFELYKLFLNDNILQLIIEETNKYSIQCGFSANRRKHQLSWKPVTVNELKAFFAILLIMGIVQMPDIRLYWTENNIYNTTCSTEDPLNKINKIVAKIITTFKNVIKPGKTVVIDETMILWRGRLCFRQYLKGKRHKYGMKVYKLCLPNGYTYDLDIYAGKKNELFNIWTWL
ncbi:hypothetical protein M0802_011950 [Mischocyttarus mexicanus]|nr:hypothetical protein M0802_011950 [Mischocyttarus mexicanus]